MTAGRTRLAAGMAAIAFVVGTIVIPALHLVFHALPHDHDAGAIHYHLQSGDVPHDHPVEHEADHHHHDDQDRGREPFDPHHGDGSYAHFSFALGDAPASTIDLAIAGAAEQGRVVALPEVFCASAHVSVVRFRGPPAAI